MQFQEGEDTLTRNRPAEVRVGPRGFCEAPPSLPGTICMFAAWQPGLPSAGAPVMCPVVPEDHGKVKDVPLSPHRQKNEVWACENNSNMSKIVDCNT